MEHVLEVASAQARYDYFVNNQLPEVLDVRRVFLFLFQRYREHYISEVFYFLIVYSNNGCPR